jgi:hypothetical protein
VSGERLSGQPAAQDHYVVGPRHEEEMLGERRRFRYRMGARLAFDPARG